MVSYYKGSISFFGLIGIEIIFLVSQLSISITLIVRNNSCSSVSVSCHISDNISKQDSAIIVLKSKLLLSDILYVQLTFVYMSEVFLLCKCK